jgi:LmbE family N-acetylglucosaminyl deacetylase
VRRYREDMAEPQIFPEDWTTALLLVAHPDDPEYGMAAAVAKWTAEGKRISYGLASSGERGIAGMAPGTAGPVREEEQRRSAGIVGVDDVRFWGFPDSSIEDTPGLRQRICEEIERVGPDIVITLWGGPDWGPGLPNQRDHMQFTAAVAAAARQAGVRAYQTAPEPTLLVDVTGYTERAVESLAEHRQYLSVLDPHPPVIDQARAQVISVTGPRGAFRHAVGLTELH